MLADEVLAHLVLAPSADFSCQQAKGLSKKQEEAAQRLQWQVAVLDILCTAVCYCMLSA